jgi:hypothetical protein
MILATKSFRYEEKKLIGKEFYNKLTTAEAIIIILAGCFGIAISLIVSTMDSSTILSPFASFSSSEEMTSILLDRDIGGTPLAYLSMTLQPLDSYNFEE